MFKVYPNLGQIFFLFICLFFFFVCILLCDMAYNNNFSNFNGNSYYTPISFSDITNPAYHNFNQPSVSDWSYRINITHTPNLMTIISRIISTLHRVNGDSPSPESNFHPTCPPYPPCPQYSQDSYSVPPVQNRKSSILEMSMRESKQQSQNLMDSQV